MKNPCRFVLLAACIVMVVVVFCGPAYSQREDYVVRESRASQQAKQRLAALRSRIQSRKLTFKVGHTYPAERGVENILGGRQLNVAPATARKQNTLATELLKLDADARTTAKIGPITFKVQCSASLPAWDWRKEGKITPIRQQKCGNCWAYAALAAFESSYLIRNNLSIDGSEQYVVSNNDNGAGACEPPGGWASKAIEFLVTGGTTAETIMPDLGMTGTPNPSIGSPLDGLAWGWADPDNAGNPGVQKIKQAVCDHGAVATWIDAGGSFGNYTGGVYNDDDDKEPGHKVGGHFVAIIGWDQAKGAWLIRNSWGQNWGDEAGFGSERGYGWITYGTHKVGSDVSWIRAEGARYRLPPKYYELMPLKRVPVIRTPLVRPAPVNRP